MEFAASSQRANRPKHPGSQARVWDEADGSDFSPCEMKAISAARPQLWLLAAAAAETAAAAAAASAAVAAVAEIRLSRPSPVFLGR
mmetsp:Transcript_82681/g.188979  ORF Transcript_82681/g.188979 Transcript_82681/m.188979 type:complete len:86 (+) Transcript_82681:868-1125(+)